MLPEVRMSFSKVVPPLHFGRDALFFVAFRTFSQRHGELNNSLQDSVYEEVVRRISVQERQKVERQLLTLSPEEQRGVLSAAARGDVQAICRKHLAPSCALLALREGKMSLEDFATLSEWSALPGSDRRVISLFRSDGSRDPEGFSLVLETLQRGEGNFFSPHDWDRFFSSLREKSPLQRRFCLEEESFLSLGVDIRQRIHDVYWGFNVFSRCTHEGRQKLMIPSVGMMQTFLEIKCGSSFVKLHPVLGLSTTEDIECGERDHKRDYAVHYPSVTYPEEADGFYAGRLNSFAYHDFFHAFLASLATPKTRERFLVCARVCSDLANEFSGVDRRELKLLYEDFVDMEFSFHFYGLFPKKAKKEMDSFLEELEHRLFLSPLTLDIKNIFLQRVSAQLFTTDAVKEEVRVFLAHRQDEMGKEMERLERILDRVSQGKKTEDAQEKVSILSQILTFIRRGKEAFQRGEHPLCQLPRFLLFIGAVSLSSSL